MGVLDLVGRVDVGVLLLVYVDVGLNVGVHYERRDNVDPQRCVHFDRPKQ